MSVYLKELEHSRNLFIVLRIASKPILWKCQSMENINFFKTGSNGRPLKLGVPYKADSFLTS
jgi:hypothetical protein